jgi:hypothetical protein
MSQPAITPTLLHINEPCYRCPLLPRYFCVHTLSLGTLTGCHSPSAQTPNTLCPCPCPALCPACPRPRGGCRWPICCCCRRPRALVRPCPCPALLGLCCGCGCACCCGRRCYACSRHERPCRRHQYSVCIISTYSRAEYKRHLE